MELKYLVLISCLGVVASFTVSKTGGREGDNGESGSLEAAFPSTYTQSGSHILPPLPVALPQEDSIREKRHLKWKKGKGETIVVDRRQTSYGEYGYPDRDREVHYHHHYSPVEHHVAPPPRPQEYHHYHGGYSGGYGSYGGYGGGYYYHPKNNNDQSPTSQGPVVATPEAHGHNQVDRGQGAAAVNNIAIIHARAGTSLTSGGGSGEDHHEGYKAMPASLPVDVDGLFASSEH